MANAKIASIPTRYPKLQDVLAIVRSFETCGTCNGTGINPTRNSEHTKRQRVCVGCDGKGILLNSSCNGELWEALAAQGVIPFDWTYLDEAGGVGSFVRPEREAACTRCHRDLASMENAGCSACIGIHALWPHPWTIGALIAIASNPQGITTVEALVRETWSVQKCYWRVVPVLKTVHIPGDGIHIAAFLKGVPGRVDQTLERVRELGYGIERVAYERNYIVLQCPEYVW